MTDTFELADNNGVRRFGGTAYAPGATPGDVFTVQADGSLAAEPGGGSLPSVIVWEQFGHTINPGSTYRCPVDSWNVAKNDGGATITPPNYSITLPAGYWLCGGYLDTSNEWPAEATGYVDVGVLDETSFDSSPVNLGVIDPKSGRVASTLQNGAQINAVPVLIQSPGDNVIYMWVGNQSDQALVVSGLILWALKVA